MSIDNSVAGLLFERAMASVEHAPLEIGPDGQPVIKGQPHRPGGIAIKQIVLSDDQVSEAHIPEPGIVRFVAIGGTPDRVAGLDGKTRVRERVVLFVEHDPDVAPEPTRLRAFLVLGPGQAFSLKPGVRADFCGVGLSWNTGAVAYVYELVETSSRLESPSRDP